MIRPQRWNDPLYGNGIIARSIDEILTDNIFLSLATVKKEDGYCRPLNATCGFAFNDDIEIYILSPPQSEHGVALQSNLCVALAIYDSHQSQKAPKKGLQISGACVPSHEITYQEAIGVYKRRFPWMEQYVRWHPEWREGSENAWLYKIVPESIKIFDEERFGEERFVHVKMPRFRRSHIFR